MYLKYKYVRKSGLRTCIIIMRRYVCFNVCTISIAPIRPVTCVYWLIAVRCDRSQCLFTLLCAGKLHEPTKIPNDVVTGDGRTTHDSGGTIDIVGSRSAYDAATVACFPVVSVLDSGLSDQRLLRWSVAAGTLPCPQLRKKTCRAWHRHSVEDFIREVEATALCQSDRW